MSPNSNTAFFLVPGSFSPASYYNKVADMLRGRGYHVRTINLATCVDDQNSPESKLAATLYKDADIIRDEVERFPEDGFDVVLAMNSCGGFPGSESAKGLGKTERQQQGRNGGLVRLVYLASFLPDTGFSVESIMGESMPEQLRNPEVCNFIQASLTPIFIDDHHLPFQKGEYMRLSREGGGKWIFSNLSEEDADYRLGESKYHSRQSYSDQVTYLGWKYIPSTYLSTANDYGLPPAMQNEMVEMARKKGANIELVETEGDHVPMLSIPDEVTRVLLKAAGLSD